MTAHQGGFDVIVLDLSMPEVDGVKVYQTVASRYPGLERKVLFVTGGAFTQRLRDFLEACPNPRLSKPFQPRELHGSIATARR